MNLLGSVVKFNLNMSLQKIGVPVSDGSLIHAQLSVGNSATAIITQGKTFLSDKDHFFGFSSCKVALFDLTISIKTPRMVADGVSSHNCESLLQEFGKSLLVLSNHSKQLYLVNAVQLLKDWKVLQNELNSKRRQSIEKSLVTEYVKQLTLSDCSMEAFSCNPSEKSVYFLDHMQRMCKATEIKGKCPSVTYVTLDSLQTKKVNTLMYGLHVVDPKDSASHVLWIGRKADGPRSTFLAITDKHLKGGKPLKIKLSWHAVVQKVIFLPLGKRRCLGLMSFVEAKIITAIYIRNRDLQFVSSTTIGTELLTYRGWNNVGIPSIRSIWVTELTEEELQEQHNRFARTFRVKPNRSTALRLHPLSIAKSRPLIKIKLRLDHKLVVGQHGGLVFSDHVQFPNNGTIPCFKQGVDFDWLCDETILLRLD